MMTRLGRPFPVHVCIYLAVEMQCFGWGTMIENDRGFQAENNRAATYSSSGQSPALVKQVRHCDFNSFLEEEREAEQLNVHVFPRLDCWSSENSSTSAATTTFIFS